MKDSVLIPYKIGEEWYHCVTFNCDGCAFRDNISQGAFNSLMNPGNIKQMNYNINKLFEFLHMYVGFGRELNYLNFLLPAEGNCRCNWDQDYI